MGGINVEEFVRNKYGIARVINIEEQDGMQVATFDRNIVYMVNVKTGEIKDDNLTNKLPVTHNIDFSKIKHSFNIIDLIEVGDYVNGFEVENVTDEHIEFYCNMRLTREQFNDWVKSIVTKEAMKSVEYTIE